MIKILVLGANGMLGTEVVRFLSKSSDYSVVSLGRNTIPRFDALSVDIKDMIYAFNPEYVINCIGAIKQRVNDPYTLYKVNSWFSRELAINCYYLGCRLIHISTDCVYGGSRGFYKENDLHDASDDYGLSKSLGEFPEKSLVLRTSIIGEKPGDASGLLEWVRNSPETILPGFENHLWNGITTTTFARVCDEIIRKNMWFAGLRHVFSPKAITKKDLLEIISWRYELDKKIVKCLNNKTIDRTLSSEDLEFVGSFNIPNISKQLSEHRSRNNV
jgi:dTDP-4-dehydrorhamnose reductase